MAPACVSTPDLIGVPMKHDTKHRSVYHDFVVPLSPATPAQGRRMRHPDRPQTAPADRQHGLGLEVVVRTLIERCFVHSPHLNIN